MSGIDIRNIDLNLLVVFDAVMAEQSLTQAGKRLGMTQSAVSHALARMRVMLQDPLFERTRRGVVPTARAQEIAGGITTALAALADCYAPARGFDPAHSERAFVFDLPVGLDAVILPPLLELVASNPGVTLRAFNGWATDIQHTVRGNEALIAIDYAPMRSAEYRDEALFEDGYVVLARRRHPLVAGPVSRELYASLSHIVLTWVRSAGPSPLDLALRSVGLSRRARMHVPQITSMPALIVGSDLVATLPNRIARSVTKGTSIAIHPLDFDVDPLTFYMIWSTSMDSDAGHEWLRSSVRSIVAKL